MGAATYWMAGAATAVFVSSSVEAGTPTDETAWVYTWGTVYVTGATAGTVLTSTGSAALKASGATAVLTAATGATPTLGAATKWGTVYATGAATTAWPMGSTKPSWLRSSEKPLRGLDSISEGRGEWTHWNTRVDVGGGGSKATGKERRQDLKCLSMTCSLIGSTYKGLHSDSLGC